MLRSNLLRNLSLAALVLAGALIACSSDDSGARTGTAGSGAGGASGTACQQACYKFENECQAGTCTVGGSTCDGNAKKWADCINSKPCAQKDDCMALIMGNGGSAGAGGGAGGGGGTACVDLANKCQSCGTNYQMMAQCGQTAQAKDETACQAMLADAAFQAACP